MLRSGAMRIVTGLAGTELKWCSNTPVTGSLFAAIELLEDWNPPFLLRYFMSGWMEEKCAEFRTARSRLLELSSLCDRIVFSPVLTAQKPIQSNSLPPLLSNVVSRGRIAPDVSVICIYNCDREVFQVEHIGALSMFAKVFGTSVSSTPCSPTGPYGKAVSESYFAAVRSGTPLYEHVLASLALPDKTQRWVPYHRLVLPVSRSSGPPSVTIVSEIAPVEIRLV